MSKTVETLLRNSLGDVCRLINRSDNLELRIRQKEFIPVLDAVSNPYVDQIFDRIYPVVEHARQNNDRTIDLSDMIDESLESDPNVWLVVFMNSVLHSILEGAPIEVIKVPMKVDTGFLSIFIRLVQGANRIRHKEPVEIRILPSSSRKEVKE